MATKSCGLLVKLLALLRKLITAAIAIATLVLLWSILDWFAYDFAGLDSTGDRVYLSQHWGTQPERGGSATEPAITASASRMQLAYIPPGKFIMGSPSTELFREANERPHKVRISKSFYLGVHEVTVGQFQQFVAETGYVTDAERPNSIPQSLPDPYSGRQPENWRQPGYEQTDNCPVVCVSWDDATAFCQWLSSQEGCEYRLPTEAEWEYACRAGGLTPYSTREHISPRLAMNLLDHGPSNSGNLLERGDEWLWACPVGSLPPNRFGICEMHGNVWEWCADWYGKEYYSESPQDDPPGPGEGTERVIRGGSWFATVAQARSANRASCPPRHCITHLGFRVARTAP